MFLFWPRCSARLSFPSTWTFIGGSRKVPSLSEWVKRTTKRTWCSQYISRSSVYTAVNALNTYLAPLSTQRWMQATALSINQIYLPPHAHTCACISVVYLKQLCSCLHYITLLCHALPFLYAVLCTQICIPLAVLALHCCYSLVMLLVFRRLTPLYFFLDEHLMQMVKWNVGSFCIARYQHSYSISVVQDGQVRHIRVIADPGGGYKINKADENRIS